MSKHDHTPAHATADSSENVDGKADVFATIALIALVVGAAVFWLKSFAA